MSDSGRDGGGLVLDEQLCFALYAASQAVGACYRSALEATGLTFSQYLVMLVLWEDDRAEGGPAERGVSLKVLGGRLRLDNGTLSPLVKRLEQRGLVTRTRSREDERELRIACSPRGRALYRRAAAAQAEVAEAASLSAGEIAVLRDALYALTDRLRPARVS